MTEVYTSDAYRAAVEYRERGWPPIPIKARSKAAKLPKDHPFLSRKATDDEFAGFDFRHNVGIVGGKVGGVIVLDDDDDGETMRENGWHVPATPTVRTKRGHQYYFRCPEAGFPTFDVAEKVEVRGDGAYAVAPPSVHPSGSVYEWVISPEDADLADPPEWLMEQAAMRGRRMRAEDVREVIANGSRNKVLFSIAGTLRRRGLDEASIAAALLGINATKCEPPLPENEVRKIARSAARYDPAEKLNPDLPPEAEERRTTHPERGPGSFYLTDLGNAERLVAAHGNALRYCHLWAKWLVYDVQRWEVDAAGEVERRAGEAVRMIYSEAEAADDKDERRAIARHATASEARSRIDAMIALARSMVAILPDQLDRDPWLLNVENGTVDLRTGKLREHRREDLITKLAPVEYDPDARAPTFEAFLERILPSEALRRFVQRALGYAAAGVVSEEVLVILYGVGANGKSTLVNVVMEALGGYAMQAAPNLLLAKRGSHPTELADLFGARFVASVETDEGRRLAEGLVKQLTGRDPIKARRMREDFWQFDPTHTVFLATNHRPEVKGTDHAIWRRLKLVPFEVTIPEAEQDKRLPEKLRAELPGILAWIVRGCLEWRRGGLGEPEEVRAATTSYRDEMDILAGFIEDRCVIGPDVWVKFSDLYAAYQEWCDESGEKAETKRRFGTRLKERGFEPDRGTDNVSIRRGIGLEAGPPGPEGRSRVIPKAENYPTKSDDNPFRYGKYDEQNYRNYPDFSMNEKNPSRGDLYTNQGNYGNSSNSEAASNPANPDDPDASTPRGGSDRPLTEGQEQRYRKLIRGGMSPKWARKTILASDHPLDCVCEVCA